MENWGEIELQKIEDGDDLWVLFDELVDDKSGFFFNRSTIIESYKDGNLYGLYVNENQFMFDNRIRGHKLFARDYGGCLSWYLLPCFCIKENDKCIILWVHSRARRKGFGTKLVKLLNIKEICTPLPESLPFWKACNLI
tara:strand:+ start:196 stop:612 length:417 start_codon:yes stop_codon:yes gene_type:complete